MLSKYELFKLMKRLEESMEQMFVLGTLPRPGQRRLCGMSFGGIIVTYLTEGMQILWIACEINGDTVIAYHPSDRVGR